MRDEEADSIGNAKSHGPGSAKADLPLGLAGVLVLANGRDAAGGIDDETTVARRIRRLEGEHGDVRAGIQRSVSLRRVSASTSGVSANMTSTSPDVCPAPTGPPARHPRCRPGGLLENLDSGARRFASAPDPLASGPITSASRPRRPPALLLRAWASIGPAADRMEHLRQSRAHAHAFAGGQQDHQQGSIGHGALLIGALRVALPSVLQRLA